MKDIFRRLLLPPTPFLMIFVPAATVMLIYALADANARDAAKYVAYFASAYALTAVCMRIPQLIKYAKDLKQRNRYVSRYVNDVRWRVQATLQISLVLNGLYAALQLISGLHYRSRWFYSLAGYYALLAVMRWVLLKYVQRKTPGADRSAEYKRFRFCGVVMLLMNQALVAMVYFIVFYDRGTQHNYIITIAMAAYTFTAIPLAINNLIKFRKYSSPVLAAAKVLSFTSALVSVLSLETAMLAAFGGAEDHAFRQLITGCTGFAVCAIELVMAVIMIARSTRAMRELR